jgi:nucleoside-diphosphate-sugar epimerase
MTPATSHSPAPRDARELDDVLSLPGQDVIDMFRQLPGDLLILGVGGKMGPTLARLARRAADAAGLPRRVIGVSRFSGAALPKQLESWGVETIRCDLLDEAAVARLPDAPLVINMAGFKFGAAANPSLTWAMNCYLPAVVCRRFRASRIVVFSSGNVYGMVPVDTGGSVETDEPRPVGEYAITVLGRERIFDYFSRELRIPVAVLRLNYATELRYGVLVDLGRKVWNNEPIDLSMSYVNVIWQGEANNMSLRALGEVAVPPRILNVAGGEVLSVRDVTRRFGELMGRQVRWEGAETKDALINNASGSYARLGRPAIDASQMIAWTADWIMRGGESLDKPTHFESRDGRF